MTVERFPRLEVKYSCLLTLYCRLIANRAQKISTEYRPITDFTQVAIVVRHQDGTFGLEAHTSRSRVAISLAIKICSRRTRLS